MGISITGGWSTVSTPAFLNRSKRKKNKVFYSFIWVSTPAFLNRSKRRHSWIKNVSYGFQHLHFLTGLKDLVYDCTTFHTQFQHLHFLTGLKVSIQLFNPLQIVSTPAFLNRSKRRIHRHWRTGVRFQHLHFLTGLKASGRLVHCKICMFQHLHFLTGLKDF